MKTLLLTTTLLFTIFISAQTRTFKYTFDINSGTMVINFANCKELPEYGNSRAGKGKIQITCRQEYIDFQELLSNQSEGYYHFSSFEVYVGDLSDYFLIIDYQGALWKLSYSDALILGNQMLNVPSIILEQIIICPDVICVCH